MKLLEPFYKMEVVIPTESMGDIMGDITGRRGRVLGLDSGCVYGGGLTAWCPAEDRVVTVPSRPGTGAA